MSDPQATVTIRGFQHADAVGVRALVLPEIERSGYRSAPRAALETVLATSDPESQVLVAIRGATLVGVAIHGMIAGSEGAGRLQLLFTAPRSRRTGVARSLVGAALDALRSRGARFAIVEMPDDPALEPARALFERSGFRVESRVADFFRDGIDLVLYRRELSEG